MVMVMVMMMMMMMMMMMECRIGAIMVQCRAHAAIATADGRAAQQHPRCPPAAYAAKSNIRNHRID
eukprot:2180635-Rhodomonas_salina.1